MVADRYGTRWVSLVGSVISILGVLLTATATSRWPIVLERRHPLGRPVVHQQLQGAGNRADQDGDLPRQVI